MARVFVSYRRADGLFSVGWLAERLRSLDSITGVETAFHDAALRAGDDFHLALDAEIAASDLVIAMIGPEWRGASTSGPSRIQDPDDWVVREIASAFQQGTRVLPVLVDRAEHPTGAEMHESIDELARLHALPFNDGRDLDTVVEHVESHLTEIDHERAKLAGLEQPIEVPRLERPTLLALGAVAAAAAGAFVGWLLASYRICADGADCSFQGTPGYDVYEVLMPLFGAYVGVTGLLGVVLARRLHRVVTHRWLPLLGTVAFIGTTVLLLTLSSRSGNYAITEAASVHRPVLRFWGVVVLTGIGAAISAGILSARYSTPRSEPHLLAERVRTLGISRDAERWSVVLLSIEFALVAAAGAAILAALDQAAIADTVGPLPNIAFALVFSVVMLITHGGAVSRLDEEQADIERSLADVPPRYRDNATPRLVATAFDGGSWTFRLVVALPVIVTIVADLIEILR